MTWCKPITIIRDHYFYSNYRRRNVRVVLPSKGEMKQSQRGIEEFWSEVLLAIIILFMRSSRVTKCWYGRDWLWQRLMLSRITVKVLHPTWFIVILNHIVACHLPRGSKLRWLEDMGRGLPSAWESLRIQLISLFRTIKLPTYNAYAWLIHKLTVGSNNIL